MRNRLRDYVWSLALLALAVVIRISLDPWLGDTLSHPTIFTAVLITTWYFGTGPAILNTILGYPVIEIFVLDKPFSHWSLQYLLPSLCLYAGLNVIVIALVSRFRKERDRLQATERTLRESEQRIRASFENAALGIIETDGRDQCAAVNERICQILGYTREALIGKSIHDLTAPEDRASSIEQNAAIASGKLHRVDYEKRYLRRDGSRVWVHLTVSAIRDEAGRYVRSIGTVEDISQRKQTEQQDRLLLEAVRSAAVGIVVTDREGSIIWVNPSYTRITGYGSSELVGRKPGILKSGKHPVEFYQNLWDTILRGETWRGEIVNRRKDGSLYTAEMTITPVSNEPNRITHFVAAKEDVTQRRRAEEALGESELRLRLACRAAQLGIFDWNIQTGVNVWSAQLQEMYGLPPGGFAGTQDAWEKLVHPDDRGQAIRRVELALETGQPVSGEWRVIWPDRSMHWIAAWFQVFKDEENRPLRLTGVNIDITERKRLEHELRAAMTSAERAKRSAEEANSAKDQFLAVLSHELRTPLSPVLAAIQLMERDKNLDARLQRHIEVIRRNLELEARLIDDLLDLTRIVRGKILLERQSVHVGNLIERVVEICRPDIEARKLHFALDIECSGCYINADASRLQQVLWNILKNAIKFTPDGGCVGIRCYEQPGLVTIEVNDSGIGIDPELSLRIFNAFEQGGPSVTRQFGGLGLGLAITKRLVEMHAGTISVQSQGKDKGSTFTVSLPRVTGEAGDSADLKSYERTSIPDRASKHILLVEDHGDTADMMKLLLQSSGFEVEVAGDFKQGLDIAGSRQIDLLISDLGLPDRSGLELIRELRHRGSMVKAIALSGFGREEDIERSKEAGFAAHLTKPVDFDTLVRTVDNILGTLATDSNR